MSKEILLNKLEKQFSYYELVDEMQETINYSKIIDFLDNEKDQKIADLEVKLAERDKTIDEINKEFLSAIKDWKQLVEIEKTENEKLKQQLAESEAYIQGNIPKLIEANKMMSKKLTEKDAEIEQWKSMAERSSGMLDRFNYCGESIVYNTTREQDKISFAVEQLVNIQKYISDNAVYVEEESFGREINEHIDNQIKAIKEMK